MMSALDQWEARKLGVTKAAHADNTQCYITSQKPGPDHLIVTEFKKHFMFLCPRIGDTFSCNFITNNPKLAKILQTKLGEPQHDEKKDQHKN